MAALFPRPSHMGRLLAAYQVTPDDTTGTWYNARRFNSKRKKTKCMRAFKQAQMSIKILESDFHKSVSDVVSPSGLTNVGYQFPAHI